MCLIVEKRAGDRLEYSDVKDWSDANPDGWGFMSVEKGQVVVAKGFGFKKLWRTVCQRSGESYYLHLRMATHGEIKDGNTHPYLIADGVWLMHNGVMSDVECTSNPARSDTWHFIDQIVRPLLADSADGGATIRSEWFRTLLESYVGASNRLVIMDGLGAVTFSNNSWHTMPVTGMRVSNTYALGAHKCYDLDVAEYMSKFSHSGRVPLKTASGAIRSAFERWQDERDEGKAWKDPSMDSWSPDPWENEANYSKGFDRTVEHDIAYLEQCDTVAILTYVEEEPERAAAVLYDLLAK